MHPALKDNKGLSLIELLVALAISSLVIGALYGVFIGQQRTHGVQEQVVEMRQAMRGPVSTMIRELRMAGFGNVDMVLPITLTNGAGVTVSYPNIVNRDMPSQGWISIVSALLNSDAQSPSLTGTVSRTIITVSSVADFDTGNRRYISIGGIESNEITNINGNQLTLLNKMTYTHNVGTRIYPIRAISYGPLGERDDHAGSGPQPIADNLESIQYGYLDDQGNPEANDARVQMVNLRVTALTDDADPQYKSGDGHRRREVSSNVQLRNVSASPSALPGS